MTEEEEDGRGRCVVGVVAAGREIIVTEYFEHLFFTFLIMFIGSHCFFFETGKYV